MTARRFCWERFRAVPIVGILRRYTAETTRSLLWAARRGGLTTLEITLDTPGAAAQIRDALAEHADALNVGAGTVTSTALLEVALEAGAQFIVTPTVVPAVIGRCRALGVPVFPGALSPSEVVAASEAGADLVKLFPADHPGPGYVQALVTEFPRIGLLPTGGVDLETLPAFRAAGAAGFGVGSPLFRPDRVAAGDWDWVAARCGAFRELATGVQGDGRWFL